MIITLVGYILLRLAFNTFSDRILLEGQIIEIVWTLIPTIILIFIAFPSLRLLYLLDEVYKPLLTIKAIGHQWYWSYEYSDFANKEFDSYIISWDYLIKYSHFRLLEVDNNIVVPILTQIRLIVSSRDVIHSWAVPSLGIKIDAIPGRLNQVRFTCARPGLFYGQCSEICGLNHRFMPIVLERVNLKDFIKWTKF